MKIAPKQYAIALYNALDKEKNVDKIKQKIKKFAEILKNNNDLKLIDKIIAEFDKYWDEQKGIINLTVKSARPLSKPEKDKLKKWFESRGAGLFGKKLKKVVIEEKIDENLIGGIVLKIGDTIIDGGIKSQLYGLRRQLF